VHTADADSTSERSKLILISWVPARNLNGFNGVKARMLGVNVSRQLKRTWDLPILVQASDDGDLSMDYVFEKVTRQETDTPLVGSAI